MAEILTQHIYLPITKLVQFSLSKTWKNTFSEATPNCLAKFGQRPADAVVKI